MTMRQPQKLKFLRKFSKVTCDFDRNDYTIFDLAAYDKQGDTAGSATNVRYNDGLDLTKMDRWHERLAKGETFTLKVNPFKDDPNGGARTPGPSNSLKFNNHAWPERIIRAIWRSALKLLAIFLLMLLSGWVGSSCAKRNIGLELEKARLEGRLESLQTDRSAVTPPSSTTPTTKPQASTASARVPSGAPAPAAAPSSTPTTQVKEKGWWKSFWSFVTGDSDKSTPIPESAPVADQSATQEAAPDALVATMSTLSLDSRVPTNAIYVARGIKLPEPGAKPIMVTNYVAPDALGTWFITPVDCDIQFWPRANRNSFMVFANTNSLENVGLVGLTPKSPHYDGVISYWIIYTGDKNMLSPEGMEVDIKLSPLTRRK